MTHCRLSSVPCLLCLVNCHINPIVRCVPLASLSCTLPGQKPILDVDVMLSPLLLPKSGTIYLPPLKSHHHLTSSDVTSNTLFYIAIMSSPHASSSVVDSPHLWFIFLTLVHYQLFYITLLSVSIISLVLLLQVKKVYCFAKRSVIQLAAVKIIDRQKAPQDYQEKFLPRELKHWPKLRHPNLIALNDWFQVPNRTLFFTFYLSMHF